MTGRAERRRAERAAARNPKPRVIIAGDNIVATGLGHEYEARPRTELGPKIPGEHRWIVTAAWRTTVDVVRDAFDPDRLKLMDNENLIELAIGCWDCECILGDQGKPGMASADSRCAAGDEWTPHDRPRS